MAKVEELIGKYYFDTNYNCAEAIFSAAMEAWNLDVPKEAVKGMAGFGGGLGSGLLCGAIVGGTAALSHKYVQGDGGHTSPLLMKKVRTFVKGVREDCNGTYCKDLRKQFHDPEKRCYYTICKVAHVLDQVDEMDME